MKKLKLSLTENDVTVAAEITIEDIAKHKELGIDTLAVLLSGMQTKLDIETMTNDKFYDLCALMSKEQLLGILIRHRYSIAETGCTKLITDLNTYAYYETNFNLK